MLNYPKLPLPDVEETIAYRAVDRILLNDPVLKKVVRDYNSYIGGVQDIFDPTPSTCPNIQLAPKPNGSRWEAEGMHRMPLVIGITCAVNGSNVDQIMNFWGHIRRALFPKDPARFAEVRKIVAEAGIVKATITLNAYGIQLAEKGARMLIAQGSLELLLHIHTP